MINFTTPWMKLLLGTFVLCLSLSLTVGCSDVEFSTKKPGFKGQGNPDDSGDPDDPPPEVFDEPNDAKGIFKFESSINGARIWVAALSGDDINVYSITVDKANNYPMKSWVIPGENKGGGTRTYVSEIGLILGRKGGKIFRVSENMPQGAVTTPIWQASDAYSNTRSCVTSYTSGGRSYLGIAWRNNSGYRVFTRIPIDKTKPNGIDSTQAVDTVQTTKGGAWSYSCFIDQGRKYFWSSWYLSPEVVGINLNNMNFLTGADTPNAGHTNSTLREFFVDPSVVGGKGSYAFAGDAEGNALSGTGLYTYVHETRHNITYGSHNGAQRLIVADPKCFSILTSCAGKYSQVSVATVGRLGPLSSLNDGRIVGIVRGTNSQIYLVWPTNPASPISGLSAERIKEVQGNAYMYNDFTGGSLYSQDIDLTINLNKLTVFDPTRLVGKIEFSWTAVAGGYSQWKGLQLSARCYKEGQAKPGFTVQSGIKDAGQYTAIIAPSCIKKSIDRLDIRLRNPMGSSDFTRTKQLKIISHQ